MHTCLPAACALAGVGTALLLGLPVPRVLHASADDLDTFMTKVLARRDDNWHKLQQYVLDERERVTVTAPSGARLFGLDREYTWYIRDGRFVRSPLRFDGVTLGESQRAEYERRFIEDERRRAERRRTRDGGPRETPSASAAPDGTNALLSLAHEPQFVSRAYFLRFRFEPKRYALAGREQLDGRTVLRIEYYPSRLFRDNDEEDPDGHGPSKNQEPDSDKDEARINRQMNKVALVTMWVLPDTHQIVRYTFDNVGFDFLPGRSVVRLDDVRATMQMGEMFPGVWLPRSVDARVAVTLANGTFRMDYDLAYMNYRQAEVKARVR
jgi:hypothetical protein